MPITKSARKATRQSLKKASFNRRRKGAMRTAIKEVKASSGSAGGKNSTDSAKSLSTAYKAIDKAAKRGIIKPNTAARKKSRLARFVNKSG